MKIVSTTSYGVKGRIQVSVVEQGRVVREYPEQPNLILNAGLDQMASYEVAALFVYAVAGTSSTPTLEQSDIGVTGTVAAGVFTSSSAGYTLTAGNTIKMGTGEVYSIVSNIGADSCNVTPTTASGPIDFTVYLTNQTGLTTEFKRTNTYLTDAPNCQTTTSGNVTTMTRTFDFDAEVGLVGYNEVGFSRVVTPGSNLFSRIKLASTVNVDVGQQLRVKYSVAVTITPSSATAFAVSPIINWPTATGSSGHVAIPLGFVWTNGNTTNGYTNPIDGKVYGAGMAGGASAVAVSTATGPWTYGSYIEETGRIDSVYSIYSAYVAGSYTRDKYATLPVGTGNSSNINSFFFEFYWNSFRYLIGPYVTFDTPQTKLSTHTLTIGFRYTWGRIL